MKRRQKKPPPDIFLALLRYIRSVDSGVNEPLWTEWIKACAWTAGQSTHGKRRFFQSKRITLAALKRTFPQADALVKQTLKQKRLAAEAKRRKLRKANGLPRPFSDAQLLLRERL